MFTFIGTCIAVTDQFSVKLHQIHQLGDCFSDDIYIYIYNMSLLLLNLILIQSYLNAPIYLFIYFIFNSSQTKTSEGSAYLLKPTIKF